MYTKVLLNRAITCTQADQASNVLKVISYPPLPPPPPNSINVRFVLSPVNPSDLNVIEGVYPMKPRPDVTLTSLSKDKFIFVGGNEGLACVKAVGDNVIGLQKEDWVIMTKPQIGTWCTTKNVMADDVSKVPRIEGLSEVNAATLTVNPPTAFNMLHDFVPLCAGDWVVQNGANSAVGQAIIQIAASKGIATLNFVRHRENLQELEDHLHQLGATKVLTYGALSLKTLKEDVQKWTSGKRIKLGLNCVGGNDTFLMSGLLGDNAHLISYGAMSKQPLFLPTSHLIFKNLTLHGFWQTQWYLRKSSKERDQLIKTLVELMSTGKLKEPLHQILTISPCDSDEQASLKLRNIFEKLSHGMFGRKLMLRFES